ncbi:PLP-dependent aminotransferase family protein [Amycolatopsis sp. CA-161197]|uniref:aminotransferase-like domain-containing protein n=1 Tax=Amycolatopsis sp. CA-161197 TaxID=3239922 RepID=UPI003D8ECB25
MVSSRSVDLDELRALLGEWRNGSGSLAERLAAAVEQAIERGELLQTWRLPAERSIAEELGVGRSTVVRSMEVLAARGIVHRVQGAGSFITGKRSSPRTASLPPGLRSKYQMGEYTGPGIIAATVPSSADLPADALTVTASELLDASPDGEPPGSGYHLAGLAGTRRAISAMLTAHGLPTGPNAVIVTTGATQSLSLVFDQALAPGDVVVVESPTFPPTLDLLRRAGVQVVSVRTGDAAVDTEGLAKVALKARAKMAVVTATCNVATGHSVTSEDRRALVRIAEAGVTVVDDCTLADYHPMPQPRPLAAMSDQRSIITVGSFNKIYWGGLRMGWIRSHPTLVPSLVRTKAKTDTGSSVPSQLILAKLLRHHDTIADLRRLQVQRRAAATRDFIGRELPDWIIEGPGHGPAMWIRLPVRDSAEFVAFAYQQGTAVGYGGMYRSDGRASQHIRLTLTSGDDEVARGVADLKAAWSAFPDRRRTRKGNAR